MIFGKLQSLFAFLFLALATFSSSMNGYEARKPERTFDVISVSRLLKESVLDYVAKSKDQLLIVPAPSGRTDLEEDFCFHALDIFEKRNSFRTRDLARTFTWKEGECTVKISVARLPEEKTRGSTSMQRRIGSSDAQITLLRDSDLYGLSKSQFESLVSSFHDWFLDEGAANDIFPNLGKEKRERFSSAFETELGRFWQCALVSDESLPIQVSKTSMRLALGNPDYNRPAGGKLEISNAMHLCWLTPGMDIQVNWGGFSQYWENDPGPNIVNARPVYSGTTSYTVKLESNPFSIEGNHTRKWVEKVQEGDATGQPKINGDENGKTGRPPFNGGIGIWASKVVEISTPEDLKRFGTLIEQIWNEKGGGAASGAFILAQPPEQVTIEPDVDVPGPKVEDLEPDTFYILSYFVDGNKAATNFRERWTPCIPEKIANRKAEFKEDKKRADIAAVFLKPISVEGTLSTGKKIRTKLSRFLEADLVHSRDELRVFTRQKQRSPLASFPSVSVNFYDLPTTDDFGNLYVAPYDSLDTEKLD